MTAQQFFQVHIFKQLCLQEPFQNVVVSPLEIEMTLLKLARAGQFDLKDLGIEDLENYLEKQEKFAKILCTTNYFGYSCQLDMGEDILNMEQVKSPFQFNLHWRNQFDTYLPRMANFHTFDHQIQEQYYLVREGSYTYWYMHKERPDASYLEQAHFQAVRFALVHNMFLECYIPHAKADFMQFIENFDLETFQEWGKQFKEASCLNILMPRVDIAYEMNYQSFLGQRFSSLEQKTGLKVAQSGISNIQHINHGYFSRNSNFEATSWKMLNIDRPFFLIIREKNSNSIVSISAITKPMTIAANQKIKKDEFILAYYEKRLPELTIRGHLAMHYWGIQGLYKHFKIKNETIEQYLQALLDCIESELPVVILGEDYYESNFISHHWKNLKKVQENILIKYAEHYDQKRLKYPLLLALRNDWMTEITDLLEQCAWGVLAPSDLSVRINGLHFIKWLIKLSIPYPSFEHFAAFTISAYDFIGQPSKIFSIDNPIVHQLPPPDFIHTLIEERERYKAFRNFKPKLFSMALNEKIASMAKCIDTYLKTEQLILQAWEDLKPFIHQFIITTNPEKKQLSGQRIADFRQSIGRDEQTEELTIFQFLSEKEVLHLFKLKHKHLLFFQLIERLGECVYKEICEELYQPRYLSNEKPLDDFGFFELYFLSGYSVLCLNNSTNSA